MWSSIMQDVRYAWRGMRRAPGFTVTVLSTLALGIGANVTIYSWAESWLRHPLPGVSNFDRIVTMYGSTSTRANLPLSYADYAAWQRSNEVDPPGLAYWIETLAGAEEYLALPTDWPRPPAPSSGRPGQSPSAEPRYRSGSRGTAG